MTGRREGGAALILSLLYTLMLGLVTAAVIQTAAQQLRMAGNDQFQEEALQQANAIALEFAGSRDNFLLAGPVGHTDCALDNTSPDCDRRGLPTLTYYELPGGVGVDYRVIRQSPLTLDDFPFGSAVAPEPGTGYTPAALFEVSVIIDGSASGLGTAHAVTGVAVPLAAGQPVVYYWRSPGVDPL